MKRPITLSGYEFIVVLTSVVLGTVIITSAVLTWRIRMAEQVQQCPARDDEFDIEPVRRPLMTAAPAQGEGG